MGYKSYGLLLFMIALGCQEAPKSKPAKKPVVVEMRSPAGPSSALPYLFTNKDVALLSWVETMGDTLAIQRFSSLANGEWQSAQTITQGGDWFVNWADYPMIAENQGHLWSHVLKKSAPDTYSYDVRMNLKPKDSAQWSTDRTLHTDGTPTEHGFVTAIPYKNGFFVNWLDGRNTLENEVGERGAMTLRGAVVSTTGAVLEEWELDPRTCDCCQTTAAITENGPVVLYRDRSEEEVRDIYIVRWGNAGWTPPKAIHADGWQIKGCPVNGPKVAALGNTLAVAWFTAPENKPQIKLAFSTDAGEKFDEPIPLVEGKAMGRVDVLLLDAQTALVSFMVSDQDGAEVQIMKVDRSGVRSEALSMARLASSRKTGFPQMERVGDQVYVAYTEVVGDTTAIKVVQVDTAFFNALEPIK
jgi:hypothetical protein